MHMPILIGIDFSICEITKTYSTVAGKSTSGQSEEQECDVRRVPAISGHGELFERGLLGQPFSEVEVVHHPGDDLLRCLTQRGPFGLGETLALALPDPLAFARHRLHALCQSLAR